MRLVLAAALFLLAASAQAESPEVTVGIGTTDETTTGSSGGGKTPETPPPGCPDPTQTPCEPQR
jgi:hypothetical protein